MHRFQARDRHDDNTIRLRAKGRPRPRISEHNERGSQLVRELREILRTCVFSRLDLRSGFPSGSLAESPEQLSRQGFYETRMPWVALGVGGMIDQLDLALRDFEHLTVSQSRLPYSRGSAISAWINQRVCPVVESLVLGREFQTLARWPLDNICAGSDSEVRSLVEEIDSGLVAALCQCHCLKQILAQSKPMAFAPEFPRAATQAVITADSCVVTQLPPSARLAAVNKPQFRGSSVNSATGPAAPAARRPWHDLASPGDYFAVAADMNLVEPVRDSEGKIATMGTLLPYINPTLIRLGDFVTRGMLARAEFWLTSLQQNWVQLQRHATHLDDAAKETLAGLSRLLGKLHNNYELLSHRCAEGPQAFLREACITLTQMYAAYTPCASFAWLGPEAAIGAKGAFIYRHRIERRDDKMGPDPIAAVLPDQIAAALCAVAGLYRAEAEADDLIAEAVHRSRLVLVSGPGRREVYWDKKLVKQHWQRKAAQWAMLEDLVRAVSTGGAGTDGYGTMDEYDYDPKDCKYRFYKSLPQTLYDLIVSAGSGTYRLALTRDQVCLLEYSNVDKIKRSA